MGVFDQLNKSSTENTSSSGGVFSVLNQQEEKRKEQERAKYAPSAKNYIDSLPMNRIKQLQQPQVEPKVQMPSQRLFPDPSTTYRMDEPKSSKDLLAETRNKLNSGEVQLTDLIQRPNETLGGNLRKVGDTLQNVDAGISNALTFGTLGSYQRRMAENVDNPEMRQYYQQEADRLNTGAAKVGDFVGTTLAGAGAYGLIGNVGRSIAQPLLRTGVRGAAAGATYGAIDEAADLAMDTRQDGANTVGQRLGNIAIETALGGALDVGIDSVSKGVRSIINKYRKQPKELPSPRRDQRLEQAQQRSVNEYGSDPIVNEYTFPLSEASPQTQSRVSNVQESRKDLDAIENELRVLNGRYEKAINDQYEYLKSSLENRGGVHQGKIFRNQEGEVIDRVGRISNNPEWYQEFFAQNGRAPNRKELYDLAKRHVDEGFIDGGYRVPSWRQQNGYDEAVSTLEEVRNTIRTSLLDLDLALNVTDQPLTGSIMRTQQGVKIDDGGVIPTRGSRSETINSSQPIVSSRTLPPMRDNYLKELKEYTDTLYRETSPDLALDLIPGSNRYSDLTTSEIYFSNKPDLALGQGKNKGVLIEFDSRGIKGQVNTSKPTWEMEYNQGNAEFRARSNNQSSYQKAVKSVTIRPDAKMDNVIKRRLNYVLSSWEKRTNRDGSITYLRPRDNNVTIAKESSIQGSLQRADVNTPQQYKPAQNRDSDSLANQIDNDFLQAAEEATQPRIRDRVYNYLDEAEKAARERIAGRRNRLSANPVDEWGDYAIIMAAKVGKGTIKAANFTEELVKEFGENIRPYANQILRRTNEELRKQTRRATKEADEAIKFNSGGGDFNSFRSKVDRNPKRNKQSFSQKWERIRTQTIDDLAPLEGVEKRIRGQLSSAEDSLYKTARLFKGTPSKANQIVQERLSPIAQQIEKAGYTMDDLGDYALAMHARDVNANYMKSGFTDAEIKDVIDKLGTPEMESARKALVQVSNDMLNELVDSGVISRELMETLQQRWPNYMPLFRSFEDDAVQFESGLSNTLANVSNPIKSLKGSERKVIDPMENMIKNIFRTVNAAERNRVASQLAKLANEPNAEGIIRRLDPNEKVERKNVVTVKENGENVKYEVEPDVYKALLNLDRESSNMLIDILSKPASMLRVGATLTPEFSLRNPMRDIVQAYVVSNSGFNPLIDFPVGLIEAIKGRKGNSQLYSQWVNDLGDYGNLMSMDRKVHREALEKVFKQPAGKKFVNIVNGRSFLNMLRAISDTTESATKLGEYRAALRRGASRQEAAYRSRDIMDFARAGASVRQANKIVAFLNANIQGKSKLIRAIKNNPVGVTTRAFTAITLPTVAAFVMQKYLSNETQQNTIAEAPDWMKDTFWLVPIPGTDTVARIPKPFDLAPIFSNLPERAMNYVYNNDKRAFDGFVQRSLGDSALPIQITGLWPFIEGMTNYSFFREGSIIPMREQNLAYQDQFDPVRTSETARLLASGVEFLTGGKGMFKNFSSPRIMDNTIQGLTAGLGSYATDAIDAILKGTGIVNRPKAPEKRLEQQPFVKAFTVDPMQSSKTLDRFYSMKEEIDQSRTSARMNEREFDKEGQYQVLNQAGNLMSDINKTIRAIEASDMSAAEKRTQIEQLQKQRLDVARRALELIEGAKR